MRVALAGSVIAIALTSCTGSPAAPTPEDAATSAARTPEGDAVPAEPASLPCPAGAQVRVVGARNTIVGEVFGRPLTSPPSRDHQNKILWRAKHAGLGDLVISASLNGSDHRVQRRVEGGPGPSIINVPKAGCWTFSLRWPEGHDVVAVRYSRPS
jgi:hypothetical protein